MSKLLIEKLSFFHIGNVFLIFYLINLNSNPLIFYTFMIHVNCKILMYLVLLEYKFYTDICIFTLLLKLYTVSFKLLIHLQS